MDARMVSLNLPEREETSPNDEPVILVLIAVVSSGGHERR